MDAAFKWAFETKKTAEHWNEYYEVLHTTEFTPHVLCKHCKEVKSHPNRNGDKSTSSIRRHLLKCMPFARHVRRQAGELPSNSTDVLADFLGWENPCLRPVMTSAILKEKLLRIIISGNLPFSFVGNNELHTVLKQAYPDCMILTRKTLVDYLSVKARVTQLELKKELMANDSKVCLALDAWSTRGNYSFLGTFR
jgi:hypothetical protein